jgi:hypothetical protein
MPTIMAISPHLAIKLLSPVQLCTKPFTHIWNKVINEEYFKSEAQDLSVDRVFLNVPLRNGYLCMTESTHSAHIFCTHGEEYNVLEHSLATHCTHQMVLSTPSAAYSILLHASHQHPWNTYNVVSSFQTWNWAASPYLYCKAFGSCEFCDDTSDPRYNSPPPHLLLKHLRTMNA